MLVLRTLERPVVSTQGILNNKTMLQQVAVALWQPREARSQPIWTRQQQEGKRRQFQEQIKREFRRV